MNLPSEYDGCGPIMCVIGALVLGFGMGGCTMDLMTVVPLRAKAVELGAAEWVVDPKTGASTFTWKEKP